MAQVCRYHNMNGDYIYGGGGNVMVLAVVVTRHEYSLSGSTGKTEMVTEAQLWWNRKWFNREDIKIGGAGMRVYVSGVCF